MKLFGVIDPEHATAAKERLEILARVDAAHAMLVILVWLVVAGLVLVLAALVAFVYKSYKTSRLLDRVEVLAGKTEDLTAKTEMQMFATANKTEVAADTATKTGQVVVATGKEIKEKIEEVKGIIIDPLGPLSQPGTQMPTVP